MRKPTSEDAHLILQLEQLRLTEANQRAFHWFWRMFCPQKIQDYAQYRAKYPDNSEGARYVELIMAFWETAGALVNNGTLNERLFFSRYLVRHYWDAFKFIISAEREQANEMRIGEHFELLAKKEERWHLKHRK